VSILQCRFTAKLRARKVKSEIVSHLSYFIGSGNGAIVVDPRRDCKIFMDLAMKEDVNINYIFETRRNEDYIIGSARSLFKNTRSPCLKMLKRD
jgi:hypothetical protein